MAVHTTLSPCQTILTHETGWVNMPKLTTDLGQITWKLHLFTHCQIPLSKYWEVYVSNVSCPLTAACGFYDTNAEKWENLLFGIKGFLPHEHFQYLTKGICFAEIHLDTKQSLLLLLAQAVFDLKKTSTDLTLHLYNIIRSIINKETEKKRLFKFHDACFSEFGEYITHNTTLQPTVWSEVRVCYDRSSSR